MFYALYNSLLTLVYPQQCRICGNSVEKASDGNACAQCWGKVRTFGRGEATCHKCGAYLGEAGDSMDLRCGRCTDHHYDRAIAAGIYEHGLAAAIVDLKSNPHIPPRCRTLILKAYLQAGFNDVSLIIPVPLSEKRMLERGYNQAEVLARFLSEKARTPFRADILIRTRHTPMHRVAMDDKARRLTVEKSFDVVRRKELPDVHVILVDDVFTSGATVSACAKILKKNGARRVDVFTLARAAYKND